MYIYELTLEAIAPMLELVAMVSNNATFHVDLASKHIPSCEQQEEFLVELQECYTNNDAFPITPKKHYFVYNIVDILFVFMHY